VRMKGGRVEGRGVAPGSVVLTTPRGRGTRPEAGKGCGGIPRRRRTGCSAEVRVVGARPGVSWEAGLFDGRDPRSHSSGTVRSSLMLRSGSPCWTPMRLGRRGGARIADRRRAGWKSKGEKRLL